MRRINMYGLMMPVTNDIWFRAILHDVTSDLYWKIHNSLTGVYHITLDHNYDL